MATRNPLNINGTLDAQDREPMPDALEDAVNALVDAMASASESHRLVVYDVLHDFYCPRCGIEQPYGDCQCQT